MLNKCGPDLYDQWVAGQIPWTDPCVKQSFDMFDTIAQTPGYVLGGSEGILGSSDAEGSYPMYSDPPTAYMYYLASFAQAFIASKYPQLAPGDDYDFFRFPTIDPANTGSITIGADIVVMLNDTPAAPAVYYLPRRSRVATEMGRTRRLHLRQPQRCRGRLRRPRGSGGGRRNLGSATLIRFGAGDTMPASVQQAWWKAMLELVDDPSKLDAVLVPLTSTAAEAGP